MAGHLGAQTVGILGVSGWWRGGAKIDEQPERCERELGAYLYAQKKLADQRLRDSTRHLDDAIADVIAKVEADIAAGDLEPVPIDVTHDAVGIDGSCIRVR